MKIKGESTTLDDLDWKILQILQENSKLTYTEIGNTLGVAHSTIYDRIKKMEEAEIIEKYTALFNLDKLGLKNVTAMVTIFTDPKESENVAQELCQSKQVLEVSTSLSEELMIIAKVVARDQEMLHSFIAHSIAPLPGVLRIRTSIITRKFKEKDVSLGDNFMEDYFYKQNKTNMEKIGHE